MIASRTSRYAAWAAGAVGLGALAGCNVAGYGTYEPNRQSEVSMIEWPYDPASDGAIIEALRYVIDSFPPGTPERAPERGDFALDRGTDPVAVSLMPGISRKAYERIARKADPYAHPLSPETVSLPRYTVGRVELRALTAWVDVHRPLPLSAPDALVQYQCIQVQLRNEGGSWRAQDYLVYPPGVVRVPKPVYVPGATPTETAGAAPE
ncbi:MAG: hypothetical protein IT439_10090 [Phycisphaerales bacterium]|nr:hypothetical protein [Phycisphaerales bacterium]